MTRCPSTCIFHGQPPIKSKKPIGELTSCENGPDCIESEIVDTNPEQEWADILCEELCVMDDLLLCFNLNEKEKAE